MKFYLRSSIFFCLFWLSSCQYHAQYRNPSAPVTANLGPGATLQPRAPIRLAYAQPQPQASQSQNYEESTRSVTPSPLILSHRQAQTHDGGFKYAFQTDNGLQQGETISPDGTRTGQYSYVDPHGQQITVKYTAGKEGFRILEGPHRTPESAPHVEQPQPQAAQEPSYQQSYGYSGGPQTFTGAEDDGSRYTQAYQRTVATAQPVLAAVPRYLTYRNPQSVEETSPSNNAIQQQPEYHDEPGKPYSFGNGYSFEFSG